MTKKNFFVSALAVMAAAVVGLMMKKRGQIKVEGEFQTKNPAGGTNKSMRGSASAGVNPRG